MSGGEICSKKLFVLLFIVSQAEISALYKRFRSLDRSHKGFLSSDELMNIPELSINPLAHRMIRLFEGVNFKEFCRLLAPFSRKATSDMKVAAMYTVFDVDGDGKAPNVEELYFSCITGGLDSSRSCSGEEFNFD